MQQDIEIIAGRLQRFVDRFKPFMAEGGLLSAMEARRLVDELDRSAVELRNAGRRVGELMRLVMEAGADAPPPIPRAPLRVVEGGAADRPPGPEAA
jgi:hypothetical protein